jgi:hypothetical protein
MESVNPRPKGLFILLLLTFFNTGSSIFFGLLTVLFLRPTEVELKKEKLEMAKSIIEIKELGMDSLATLLEKVQGMTDVLNHHFLGVNLVNIGVCLLGGVSAFFMLQRNHLGFHGYIIYNLLASINVYFFVSPSMVPTVILIVNLLVSLVFILLYAKHLPWMRGSSNTDSI